jgi:hypothetical protein
MAKIDIDRLSEEELVELNHKIVSRLRFLRETRSHVQMMDFRIGEKVCFRPPGQPEITGTLTRYNKKSVTVITDDGQRWNVHPGLLFKVKSTNSETTVAHRDDRSIIAFPPPGSKKPGS